MENKFALNVSVSANSVEPSFCIFVRYTATLAFIENLLFLLQAKMC